MGVKAEQREHDRRLMAAIVAVGLLAGDWYEPGTEVDAKVAQDAVEFTDALLAALDATPSSEAGS